MQLLYDPVIMSLGFYSREIKTYIHTNSVHRCSWQIYLWQPQTGNNPDALQWSEWINKLWHIPIMKYISKKEHTINICNNLDEPPENYAEWKKANAKRLHIVRCYLYIFEMAKFYKCISVVARIYERERGRRELDVAIKGQYKEP